MAGQLLDCWLSQKLAPTYKGWWFGHTFYFYFLNTILVHKEKQFYLPNSIWYKVRQLVKVNTKEHGEKQRV